ncbi:hypothetical protein AJ85_10900 [Alkalihalobacillus alcalophilus ATCC 27647 = CGMCC 1.3604]|uniref:Uncharacterized protein n=1 Tax=Alkalihalobacillus alcalophilus ATCC 27647 = CGMCC 1.3604 TaxID=1218173 RepID=A0A094XFL9_ALKAL|nr:hypothetical protein [Alkalihalobacillus alcalophilus]KGA97590.1 hypothetical protein BALCAV_0209590 [Alkalihalobacillus alcalophilus ATCC 27647 = CGMCC 1.3604]MED1563363.1 hypothetical protein [Alkalihalobacillus alcalophilus]THG90425.1 hypothetical protein AJ85_10900 [Alkalihalobacillus alcalophilus ATCC 27647 = CGMCC 1.3604]
MYKRFEEFVLKGDFYEGEKLFFQFQIADISEKIVSQAFEVCNKILKLEPENEVVKEFLKNK